MVKLRLRAGLVFWLFLLSAIAFLDRTNVSIAGPQISLEYGLGNVRLDWIISAFLIGYASSEVLAGQIAVRLGPRNALTLGGVVGRIHAFDRTDPSADAGCTLWMLMAIRFALGVGEAIIYPASNQFVARWISVSERCTVNGVIFSGQEPG